jgi:hypothetical protein
MMYCVPHQSLHARLQYVDLHRHASVMEEYFCCYPTEPVGTKENVNISCVPACLFVIRRSFPVVLTPPMLF